MLATSNTINTKLNDLFNNIPAITRIGTTNKAICVPAADDIYWSSAFVCY